MGWLVNGSGQEKGIWSGCPWVPPSQYNAKAFCIMIKGQAVPAQFR